MRLFKGANMPVVTNLIADTFGSHLGKYSERLKLTQKGETLAQAPLLHLQSVHILSMGVSVSAAAPNSPACAAGPRANACLTPTASIAPAC
jgi:hypothetical protein